MGEHSIIYSIFLIFSGAALLATVALYARQSLLVSYIVLGIAVGPSGFGLVTDLALIKEISTVGIIFLLFLLGLNLHPQNLVRLFRNATFITLVSSLVFGLFGFMVGLATGLTLLESMVIGGAAIFSSTIIGLKLLPATALHHQHTGEIMISILLLQDMLAIMLMLGLQGMGSGDAPWQEIAKLILALPVLVAVTWVFERYGLSRLLRRFDTIQEYVFLMAIGWCLGMAVLAESLGLSHEIGAFIAGVSIAAGPVARFIAESLRPLRDFFLIIFFFSLGAGLDLGTIGDVILPAIVLAALILAAKPVVFAWLLRKVGEPRKLSWEIGFRLGQASEFSLLLAFVAIQSGVIGETASNLIQVMTLLTFIVSSYVVVMHFPTPIAVSDKLRRD